MLKGNPFYNLVSSFKDTFRILQRYHVPLVKESLTDKEMNPMGSHIQPTQKKSFKTLKNCLRTPLMSKQVHGSKPHIIALTVAVILLRSFSSSWVRWTPNRLCQWIVYSGRALLFYDGERKPRCRIGALEKFWASWNSVVSTSLVASKPQVSNPATTEHWSLEIQ
ncbi:hypothetical protein TNCV_2230711 [Trichonephila clavipes]|uniref:Uncharacterized protein n=1 Tax=Trichonephila clavipes TaxID=2585209 RepID=A0A8X7BJX6_TRICX|nr:hypothetical protein TNCV_2230711 [Trichonephila clavipes]